MPDSAREVLKVKAHEQRRAVASLLTGLRLSLPLWQHLLELLIPLPTLLFLETRRCHDFFLIDHKVDSLACFWSLASGKGHHGKAVFSERIIDHGGWEMLDVGIDGRKSVRLVIILVHLFLGVSLQ